LYEAGGRPGACTKGLSPSQGFLAIGKLQPAVAATLVTFGGLPFAGVLGV
jgi:hypothetical protein